MSAQEISQQDKKAQKERERKALIKAVDAALVLARLHKNGDDFEVVEKDAVTEHPLATYPDLDAEQRKRAATYTAGHGGLAGSALAKYILEGKTSRQQAEDDRRETGRPERSTRTAKDPAAQALAKDAGSIAAKSGLKSAYLVKEGRVVIDRFKVTVAQDESNEGEQGAMQVAIVRDSAEPVHVELNALRGVAAGEKSDATAVARKALRELSADTGLYARKLASFLLALKGGE